VEWPIGNGVDQDISAIIGSLHSKSDGGDQCRNQKAWGNFQNQLNN
jgi:hypothetical protein